MQILASKSISLLLLACCLIFLCNTAMALETKKKLSARDYGQSRFSIFSGQSNAQAFTFIAPNGNDFVDASKNTVLDRATGLLWQKNDDGVMRNHKEATDYCNALELESIQWRLPTRAELLSLVDYTATAPSINTQYFPETKIFNYWASTPYTGTPQHAWSVLFSEGNAYCFLRVLDVYARCVADER